MNVGQLKAKLADLPDDTEIRLEDTKCNQDEVGFVSICTYGSADKQGKLHEESHYSTERYVEQQEDELRNTYVKLDKPVVVISVHDSDHSE